MAQRGNKNYQRWYAMMSRCYDPTRHAYYRYGGRGITVCDRWHRFENYEQDIGDPPPGLTLDRIDNDGNYEPGNVHWATPKEQALNTRANDRITHDGQTLTVSQWAELAGFRANVVRNRIRRCGWSILRALSTPLMTRSEAGRKGALKLWQKQRNLHVIPMAVSANSQRK